MVKDKEKAFVFYERWHTQLQRLPPEEKLAMYEAICRYAFGGEVSDMAYYLESLMDNIRMAIDADKEKQENYHARMQERSRKAVEARRLYQQVTISQPQVTTSQLQVTTSQLQVSNNKNKNKNKEQEQEQEQEQKNNPTNVGNNIIEPSTTESKDSVVEASHSLEASEAGADEKELLKQKKKTEEEKEHEAFLLQLANFFNSQVEGKAIQRIISMTPERKARLTTREGEYGRDAMFAVIRKAAASNFLNGDNGRGFIASFDWIFRPRNFPKVLEGNYDNKTNDYGNTNNLNSGSGGTTQGQMDEQFTQLVQRKLNGANAASEEVPYALQDGGGDDG